MKPRHESSAQVHTISVQYLVFALCLSIECMRMRTESHELRDQGNYTQRLGMTYQREW